MGQGTAAKERPSKALLHVGKMGEDEEQEERSDSLLGYEATYIASEETVLLSSYDVVFDTGATVSSFKNPSLLTSIAKSRREIYVKGVQADAIGVTVNQKSQSNCLDRLLIGDFDFPGAFLHNKLTRTMTNGLQLIAKLPSDLPSPLAGKLAEITGCCYGLKQANYDVV